MGWTLMRLQVAVQEIQPSRAMTLGLACRTAKQHQQARLSRQWVQERHQTRSKLKRLLQIEEPPTPLPPDVFLDAEEGFEEHPLGNSEVSLPKEIKEDGTVSTSSSSEKGDETEKEEGAPTAEQAAEEVPATEDPWRWILV
eukprot:554831-Amphidinium_carterae.1